MHAMQRIQIGYRHQVATVKGGGERLLWGNIGNTEAEVWTMTRLLHIGTYSWI